jgi:MYXO-CTERM domain-containing protein
MNHPTSPKAAMLVACAALVFVSQPALAKDIDRGKLAQGSDKLAGLCGNHDGKMWATPDGADYGCSFPGGGGILCDKDGGCLESDGKTDTRETPTGLLGLLGLAGLIGLVGVRKRRDEPIR